jgi:hypothetical protein
VPEGEQAGLLRFEMARQSMAQRHALGGIIAIGSLLFLLPIRSNVGIADSVFFHQLPCFFKYLLLGRVL